MKPRKEKTEFGSVKAVAPFKKKVVYAGEDTPKEAPKEETKETPEGGIKSVEQIRGEMLKSLLEKMTAGSSGGSKKDGEDEEEKGRAEKMDTLTEYLITQIQLRALGQLFSSVRMKEADKSYYSFCAKAGQAGMSIYKTAPCKEEIITTFDSIPFFATEEEADAFLQLCEPLMVKYGKLALGLDPLKLAELDSITVVKY